MPPENSDDFHWFAEHLRPHEGMLRAWLRAQFPSTADVDDIMQEAYLRVLQEARPTTPDRQAPTRLHPAGGSKF